MSDLTFSRPPPLSKVKEIQLLQAFTVDAILLDGTAVVQMLHPEGEKSFQDYATVFIFCISLYSTWENFGGGKIDKLGEL